MDPREREKVCGSKGKRKGVWIQGEKEKVCGSKEKEKRCVDPRIKRKGVWIQGERENVC